MQRQTGQNHSTPRDPPSVEQQIDRYVGCKLSVCCLCQNLCHLLLSLPASPQIMSSSYGIPPFPSHRNSRINIVPYGTGSSLRSSVSSRSGQDQDLYSGSLNRSHQPPTSSLSSPFSSQAYPSTDSFSSSYLP